MQTFPPGQGGHIGTSKWLLGHRSHHNTLHPTESRFFTRRMMNVLSNGSDNPSPPTHSHVAVLPIPMLLQHFSGEGLSPLRIWGWDVIPKFFFSEGSKAVREGFVAVLGVVRSANMVYHPSVGGTLAMLWAGWQMMCILLFAQGLPTMRNIVGSALTTDVHIVGLGLTTDVHIVGLGLSWHGLSWLIRLPPENANPLINTPILIPNLAVPCVPDDENTALRHGPYNSKNKKQSDCLQLPQPLNNTINEPKTNLGPGHTRARCARIRAHTAHPQSCMQT